MIVTTEYVNIPLSGNPMRTFVAAPKADGKFPGIWCYSDIFQLTPPMQRACIRLAGYGFRSRGTGNLSPHRIARLCDSI